MNNRRRQCEDFRPNHPVEGWMFLLSTVVPGGLFLAWLFVPHEVSVSYLLPSKKSLSLKTI